jgi:hypothetical protein
MQLVKSSVTSSRVGASVVVVVLTTVVAAVVSSVAIVSTGPSSESELQAPKTAIATIATVAMDRILIAPTFIDESRIASAVRQYAHREWRGNQGLRVLPA